MPHSSDYTVNEDDYMTPAPGATNTKNLQLRAKFANSFLWETWILICRNFKNIWRTPELFLSRLIVLTITGFMMATVFMNPKKDAQGITDRLSFFIFTTVFSSFLRMMPSLILFRSASFLSVKLPIMLTEPLPTPLSASSHTYPFFCSNQLYMLPLFGKP